MSQTPLFISLSVVTFGFTLWLGVYLLARDLKDTRLRYAGLGLLSYAVSLALFALFPAPLPQEPLSLIGWRLLRAFAFLPALFWSMTLIHFLPEDLPLRKQFGRLWAYSVFPVMGVLLLSSALFEPLVGLGPIILVLMCLPLLISFAVVVAYLPAIRPNRPLGILLVFTLFFALGLGMLFLPLEVVPRSLTVLFLGLDLLLLGLSIAFWDAFDQGESLLADVFRSFIATLLLGLLMAGQVAVVLLIRPSLPLLALLFGVVAASVFLQGFSNLWQTWIDAMVFATRPKLRKARAEFRAAASALPRVQQSLGSELSDDDMARLTRKALSHFGDLSRLAASPLTELPLIDRQLAKRGANDNTLERAQELKRLLAASIQKLKPPGELDMGTSDEWRYYNVLFFPYVIGLKPYSQRADHSKNDLVAQEALAYFQTYVPERTFYNWQKAAAALIAKDLQESSQKFLDLKD